MFQVQTVSNLVIDDLWQKIVRDLAEIEIAVEFVEFLVQGAVI